MTSNNNLIRFFVPNNEFIGILTEQLACEIRNIPFNTKRNVDFRLDNENEIYLKTDIKRVIDHYSLGIAKHTGDLNTSYDFFDDENKLLSFKTTIANIVKVCPQNIGQTSLEKLNPIFGTEMKTSNDFKCYILENLNSVLDIYLQHTFCCDNLLLICFNQQKSYLAKKNGSVKLKVDDLYTTRNLSNWNESTTVKAKVGDKVYSIGEFQVHNKRNCYKMRFILAVLFEHNLLENVTVDKCDLLQKYHIKVKKNIIAQQ